MLPDFTNRSQLAYNRLDEDVHERITDPSTTTTTTKTCISRRKPIQAYLIPLALHFTIALSALLLGIYLGRNQLLTDHEILLRVSPDSPLIDDIDISFKASRFNSTFVRDGNIYQQDPSPEVDAAWDALGVHYRPIVVPEHLAEKAGIQKGQVKIKKVRR